MTGLILAVAFTATSVGVTVGIWQEADALRCPSGRLLVDVAELDDISAVLLMALLFSVLPDLRSGGSGAGADVAATLAWFALKILIYGAFCYVFSKFVEGPLTRWYRNLEKPPEPMILVIGLGTLIAAVAGLLGFSLAIGAFFAGLIFSRDPESVKMEGSFLPLYEFFAPFFFIGIGLSLDPAHLAPAFGLGLVLTVAAAASKFVGNAAPVYYMTGVSGAVLIGSSMIPRAEITMVIMQKGLEMGPWAVPPHVYGAMVVVSAATCLGAPFLVKHLLATCLPKMENESWTSNHCD
jgi:Kef-type K+ transport system membrane component KefB